MKSWYRLINKELNKIINNIETFPYGNIIGYSIQLTSVGIILSSLYTFIDLPETTYFSKFGGLIVGILLNVIGKVLIAIMAKHRNITTFFTSILINWTDSLLWAGNTILISYYITWYKYNMDEVEVFLYAVIVFVIVFFLASAVKYLCRKYDKNNKNLSFYIATVFLPYRIAFIFIKPKHRLFFMVVTIASTLLLSMILLAFQVGDIVKVLNPFKSFNSNYLVLVIFMLLSDKLVSYLIPKTSLGNHFSNDETVVKMFMTWGMIVAMAAFYMFDWKLLMRGVESWNDIDKNNVLWSFTTYRLIASMMEKKFNIIDKE